MKLILISTPPPAMTASVSEYRSNINRNTILLIVSAPSYPHGVIDPVEEVAQIAREKGIPLHVDACVGMIHFSTCSTLGFAARLRVDVKVDLRA